MPRLLLVIACVSAGLGLASLLFARGALRLRRWQRTAVTGLLGLLLLTFAALLATVGASLRGYRALTHEEVAATVRTVPLGPQRFRASVTYPDGRGEIFELRGDALYVDAHILKWHPWVNLLGLHTAYELDRVAGRYERLADERGAPRTVFSLGEPKPIDLFDVARKFPRLAPLVDAEYGSATFVAARGRAAYDILVSTSGLLARPVGARVTTPASRTR
jgi:hypothetical protein